MNAMMSTITGGPFHSMTAIGSGTSLMPASTPGYMWHWMKDDWMIMAHGNLIAGFNHQGGPRGVNKAESENWFMLMAERDAGPGRLMLRGMFSAEPWTTPRRGFPELFQTGRNFQGPADHRCAAPSRPVYGTGGGLQHSGVRERRSQFLRRSCWRAGAWADGIHAPNVGGRESRRAAWTSLAGLDAHQSRCDYCRE